MLLFKKVADLQKHLNKLRKEGKTIGFAPTMGALHRGHISLIERSKKETDYTVCSIFVNPTQFNDTADLDKYPRTTAQDIKLLAQADNDIIFLPSVNEIYPPDLKVINKYDFGSLATVMEGEFRPGHFDGMAQVVKRLLDIVQPHKLFMGQKDFQQITIVRNMLKQAELPTELVMCDIIREEDGLAMSSRNVRLDPDLRTKAPLLHQTLLASKDKIDSSTPAQLIEAAMSNLSEPKGFRPEYFSIVDGITLQHVKDFNDTNFAVACTAVWVGDVRLIDNMVLKKVL